MKYIWEPTVWTTLFFFYLILCLCVCVCLFLGTWLELVMIFCFKTALYEERFPNVSNTQPTAVWLAHFGSRLFLYIYFLLPKSSFYLYWYQNGSRQLIITLTMVHCIGYTIKSSANTNHGFFWTKKRGVSVKYPYK